MKAKKILCPVDFSTNDEAALATAASLARDTGATVLNLHVEEPPLAYGATYTTAIPISRVMTSV